MEKDFLDFLVRAKRATYASNGEGGETKLSDGGKELTFKEGDFSYKDKYYGSKRFVGEEIVWQKGRAIWGMNYYGEIMDDAADFEEIFTFLKMALMRNSIDTPYRGPREFLEGNFTYLNKFSGTSDSFLGNEKIYFEKKEVFRLFYTGGKIEK